MFDTNCKCESYILLTMPILLKMEHLKHAAHFMRGNYFHACTMHETLLPCRLVHECMVKWNIYEPCMFKKLASPMHKTCVWQVYHACNMHEILNHIWTMHVVPHYIILIREAAALQNWKLCDFKKALRAVQYRIFMLITFFDIIPPWSLLLSYAFIILYNQGKWPV